MGVLTIGTILGIELGKFAVRDYLFSKAADIGTGKLWEEIKKHFDNNGISMESKLYNAIELSVSEFCDINFEDKDTIAPSCEIIYAAWILEGRLAENQIERAMKKLNSKYVQENASLWRNVFFKRVMEDEELYKWFLAIVSQESNNHAGKNQETLEKITRLLENHTHKLEEFENLLDENSKLTSKIKKNRVKYEDHLIKRIYQPILDGTCSLRYIYISLMGNSKKRNVMKDESVQIVDTTSYIWKWFQDDYLRMLFLHGEPGSGKSSLVKMVAATIATSNEMNGMVVFIDLHILRFVGTIPPFRVVESYMKEHTPWFFDENNNETRLLILDGLDEIKYNVYKNALLLVEELENCNWEFPYKIMVSGRTQIVLKSIENLRCEELEMLPLYLDNDKKYIIDKKNQDSKYILGQDLRQMYWNKLDEYFKIHQNMPLSNSKFDELSRSPLLLFLIVWTVKNDRMQLAELNNSAELYEKIFYYLYTRSHNRDKRDIYYLSGEYSEYQQMLRNIGGCAFRNNSRSVYIADIYEYCKKMGYQDICRHWVQKRKKDNPSKLVLFFFFREKQNGKSWDKNKSEIVFIHKTFYEYLAANAIVEFVYENTQEIDHIKSFPLMFFLLSKNEISDEIISFMCEIIENETFEVNGEKITIKLFAECVRKMIQFGFNENYPICIGDSSHYDNNAIQVQSYNEMVHTVKTYENNIMKFLKISEKISDKIMLKDKIFSNIIMSKYAFSGCKLNKISFENVHLHKTLFKNCTIKNVTFEHSIVNYADFESACFSHINFIDTCFAEAKFKSCRFIPSEDIKCFFDKLELQGVVFDNAYIKEADFSECDMTCASLENTIIINSSFSHINFTRANLRNWKIINVKFNDCVMKNAVLRDVDISQFNLNDQDILEMLATANLTGADWSKVNYLRRTQLLEKIKICIF